MPLRTEVSLLQVALLYVALQACFKINNRIVSARLNNKQLHTQFCLL